jgi:hypothetical protein
MVLNFSTCSGLVNVVFHDRGFNADINIERVGSSTLGVGDIRPVTIPAVDV